MRTWNFGGNGLSQFRSGSVYLIESPLWHGLLEYITDNYLGYIPCLFHWIKLPGFLYITDGQGNKYSLKEYYGDFGEVIFIKIFSPLCHWIYQHPSRKTIVIDIGYDKLKETFQNYDPDYFDEDPDYD